MQGSQDGFDELQKKSPRKARLNSKESACLGLSNQLYSDYICASNGTPGIEAEHFAEEWMKKHIPRKGSIIKESVWRHFMHHLLERRKGRGNNETYSST